MNRPRTLPSRPSRHTNVFRPVALSLCLAAIIGCSGSNSSTPTAPAVTIAPVITAFTGASSTINVGQSTQLTWAAFQATSVTLNGGTTPVTSPVTVTPAVTTTYTLTATNSIGTSTATTTVNVTQLPIITNFSALAASVPAGTSTTLNWSATGEASYTLATTMNGATTTVNESATSSSLVVTPPSTATYVLTAINSAGSVKATVIVTVTPLIKTFTATPSTVTAGQPISLAWTATGATSYSVSGVSGAVTSPIIVYPNATGTYTLTASNASASATATIPVTVTTAAALNSAGTVTTGSPGLTVSPTFMGLSIGSTSYQAILGTPATGTNKIYRKLLSNLTAYGSGPIIMRIGGNSAETQGVPTTTAVSSLGQLYTDTGTQFILGLSLQPDNAGLTISQAQAFNTTMPKGSILGLEIGNEPDLYVGNGYRTNPYNYVADFDALRTDLANAAVTNKVVGPAWSNSPSLSGMPAFLTAESPYLSVVTMHAYGGNICGGQVLAGDYLLQEAAQTRGAPSVALSSGGTASVNLVHAAGLPYRIGETNSINCSGQLGVSNTFQAALWSLDWMSRLSAAGVDGVNFFGDNTNNYSLFQFNSSTGTNGNVTFTISSIRPEYYGLVMFQQATQNTAKFLPVSVTTAANLLTYAWLDASGNIRVLVLNKDEAASGVFSITVPGYGAARLTRLTAPSYTATTGVVYNGQTLDTSTDGSLQGTAYGEIVTPATGVYSFSMPITSAALLEIPHN